MTRPVRTRHIHARDLAIVQAVRLQARLAPELIRRLEPVLSATQTVCDALSQEIDRP